MLSPLFNLLGDRLHSLPLGIVYLTDKCNSKCVTCDYWRYGQTFLSEDRARAVAAEFDRLDTRTVLLSGGEPLLHPQWAERARALAGGRRKLWLLTAGLALTKYADQAVELCDTITVSLDGATPETYLAIRGVDAFDAVCGGIRAVVRRGAKVTLRCTVQRRNYRELRQLISLARDLDVHQISFLAVDVLTHAAFARREDVSRELALSADDLPVFDQILRRLSSDFPDEFYSHFIAESPAKLRRLHQYFAALNGLAEFPPVRCNAPQFSAVFGADGQIQPCYFISGKEAEGSGQDVNSSELILLRKEIRVGSKSECKTCVCSMYRGVRATAFESLMHWLR